MISFQTIYPEGLAQVVKKITLIIEDEPSPRLNSIKYFADGLPGIMFHQSGGEILLNKGERRLSELFLYGQTVKPIDISTAGPFRAIAVHLYPHVIQSMFGVEAHELRDSCIDYELLHCRQTSQLKDQLRDADSAHAQIGMILSSLQSLLQRADRVAPPELYFATQSIIQQGGEIALRSLYKRFGTSERTFERKFLQHVGVTPSLFKRICKFQAALEQLESNTFDVLSDVAYAHGFADQSHFIRTFKEFTGLTPKEYLLQPTPVPVEN